MMMGFVPCLCQRLICSKEGEDKCFFPFSLRAELCIIAGVFVLGRRKKKNPGCLLSCICVSSRAADLVCEVC